MTSTAVPPTFPAERPAGLSTAEARARHARGEGNRVRPQTSRSYPRILIENAFTPINTVLFAIAFGLVALGVPDDALVTAVLVFGNVIVGVVQETRAKRQLDRVALLARPHATVLRDGIERTIDPDELVRGDLIVLRPGDQVLVDGRLTVAGDMAFDESLLTGESRLVARQAGDPVYSGTFCMSGAGIYEAEKVGAESTAQQITAGARTYRRPRTPLEIEIGWVIRVTALVAIALGVEVVASLYREDPDIPLVEAVQAAAVLAALVPQGLSFMVTVTYAMAAVRMAGTGALIQRMNAVESTSRVDLLCLDKTGTLTTNNLALADLYAPDGDDGQLRAVLGDYAASTEGANRTLAALGAACPGRVRPLSDAVAFDSDRKWSALSFADEPETTYVLGAPEVLRPLLPADVSLDERTAGWAERGLRVVYVVAARDAARDAERAPRLPAAPWLIGAVALNDELRPEARETIAEFARAGIALKVISGDSPDTVVALARQAGIPEGRTISGLDLNDLDAAALERVAEEHTIFGRITPHQKEALVRALRRRGHYVAMTGDGVNDVLAMKQANLAIAMRSGSAVTRGVADIVLMNDSFGVLPAAFLEGQRIRRGMEDIVRLFLVRTAYVALLIVGTSLPGLPFPTTPKHNALLALLTVGIPTLALAAWARPGITPGRLLPTAGAFVAPAALTIGALGLAVYALFLELTGAVALAQTALTTTMMLCGLTMIPFAQPPTPAWTGGASLTGDWRPTLLALALLALFVLTMAAPPLRAFTGLEPLPPAAYVVLGLAVGGWAVALRAIWRFDIVTRIRRLLDVRPTAT